MNHDDIAGQWTTESYDTTVSIEKIFNRRNVAIPT